MSCKIKIITTALCVKVYVKIMISYHKGGYMSCKIISSHTALCVEVYVKIMINTGGIYVMQILKSSHTALCVISIC